MGKLKIKLMPDGTIVAESVGVKGKKCMEYANILAKLVDVRITDIQKTEEYYQNEYLELNDSQNLSND